MAEPGEPAAESAARAALAANPGFARLLRSLELADGFRFHLLAGATPQTVRAARALLAEKGFEVVSLDPATSKIDPQYPMPVEDLEAAVLEPLTREAGTKSGRLFLIDATRAEPRDEPAWRELFRRLNERRNAVARELPGALLLAASERLVAVFTHEAPDFWSIRSTEVTISAVKISAPELGRRFTERADLQPPGVPNSPAS